VIPAFAACEGRDTMSPIIFAYEAVACDGGWVVMETDDCDPHPNTKVVSEVFATREEAEASALRMTATHEADATTAERRPCTQQRSALAHRSSPSSIDGSGGGGRVRPSRDSRQRAILALLEGAGFATLASRSRAAPIRCATPGLATGWPIRL
jgi:hypothetical protein